METFTGFVSDVELRFSDLDAMRHVNNARFLTFTEDARRAWIAHPAFSGTGIGQVGIIVAHASIDFYHAIVPPEWTIHITTSVISIGNSSFSLLHVLQHNGIHVASVELVMVAFDYEKQAKRTLEESEKNALQQFMMQGGTGSDTGAATQ